jgi:hypothetical protein
MIDQVARMSEVRKCTLHVPQGGPLLKLLQEDKRFAKIWAVSRRELEVKVGTTETTFLR